MTLTFYLSFLLLFSDGFALPSTGWIDSDSYRSCPNAGENVHDWKPLLNIDAIKNHVANRLDKWQDVIRQEHFSYPNPAPFSYDGDSGLFSGKSQSASAIVPIPIPISTPSRARSEVTLDLTHLPEDPNINSLISSQPSCFPSGGFQPKNLFNSNETPLSNWWCSQNEEYAFFGFSYSLSTCPSRQQLKDDFLRMKRDYGARYVRLYSYCDSNEQIIEDIVPSAFEAGIGVYALIWFGFNGDDSWKARKEILLNYIESSSLAKFVIRTVDVGSEPLFDYVLDPEALSQEVYSMAGRLNPYGIRVSFSEMPSSYPSNIEIQDRLLDSQQNLHAHVLPFFAPDATTGGSFNAWKTVKGVVDFFAGRSNGKKLVMTQTGWPFNDQVWNANTETAVSSVDSAAQYFHLLNDNCEYFKANGGVGWFWHLWNDDGLPGWGLMDRESKPKFEMKPRVRC